MENSEEFCRLKLIGDESEYYITSSIAETIKAGMRGEYSYFDVDFHLLSRCNPSDYSNKMRRFLIKVDEFTATLQISSVSWIGKPEQVKFISRRINHD
jgi:hypothetical protein